MAELLYLVGERSSKVNLEGSSNRDCHIFLIFYHYLLDKNSKFVYNLCGDRKGTTNMHKTIITKLLNWFVELYHATWKVIDNMEDGEEKGELVRETHALFHRKIHFRIETDFWE